MTKFQRRCPAPPPKAFFYYFLLLLVKRDRDMYENELTLPTSPFVKLVHKKRSQMKASLGVSEKGCTPKVEVSMTVARVRSWHGCNTLETKCQQSKGAKNKQKRERERIENNTGKWPFHQTRANHWDSTKFRTIQ